VPARRTYNSRPALDAAVALGLWFGLMLSASGHSVEISVTPTNLAQQKYVFSVSTNATPPGVAFHTTITAKSGEIPSDATASLAKVKHAGNSTSIEPVTPAIRVTLKKARRVWEADFTVSDDVLKQPGLCFVFTEIARTTVTGQTVPIPSADFYELRLQDFLNQGCPVLK
jgi:hypothetical protein